MINHYYLRRDVDHSNNSGTGKVADVFEIEGVGAILVWDGNNLLKTSSVVLYFSLEDLIKVHGHGGDTVLVEQPVSDIENLSDIFEIIDKSQDVLVFVANELENPEEV